MGVIEGRTWLEIVPESECYELLAKGDWGRLAVTVETHPEIFPVNYALDDERSIVFRVDAGTKLTGLHRAGVVAFQIDDADSAERRGWSVLAIGPVHEIQRSEEMKRAHGVGLQPWAVGDKVHWMKITPQRVTGRRIVPI